MSIASLDLRVTASTRRSAETRQRTHQTLEEDQVADSIARDDRTKKLPISRITGQVVLDQIPLVRFAQFAVELLLAGVPLERVSILLGHQSVLKLDSPTPFANAEVVDFILFRTVNEVRSGKEGRFVVAFFVTVLQHQRAAVSGARNKVLCELELGQ